MGLFDSLWETTVCPVCGQPGAKKFLGQVKCRNMACLKFDLNLHNEPEASASVIQRVAEGAPMPSSSSPNPMAGNFDSDASSITVRYRNYHGEEKTLLGDRRTIRLKGNHISLCVAPAGRRIALAKNRIQNLHEIHEITRKIPPPNARRVLDYHRKRGSSSPLYETFRRKYPDS